MIRRMQGSDLEQVRRIYAYYVEHTTVTFDLLPPSSEAYEAKMMAILGEGMAWGMEQEGEITGFCYAHKWKEKEAYARTLETTVYIHPDRRGNGVGRELMLQLIADAEAHGVHALIACITCPNTASEHLHERLGFEQVSRFREVGRKFDIWLDVADYQLLLPRNTQE